MYKYDSLKTFNLLKTLFKNNDKNLIVLNLNLIIHFIRVDKKYFIFFKVYLEKVLKIDKRREGIYLGEILFYLFLLDIDESESLLNKGIKQSDLIKIGVIRLSSQYLNDSDEIKQQKSNNYFRLFFNEEIDELTKSYDFSFREFEVDNFQFNLLKDYTSSNIFKDSSANYFLKFLGKCVRYYPEQCIEILSNIMLNDKYIQKHIVSDAIHILVEAYNRTSNNILKKEALEILDYVLQASGFTHLISEALELNDRF